MGMFLVFKVFILCCCFLGFAKSLDYGREAEGPCRHTSVTPNLNTTWVQNTVFPYLPAGSKYHIYRLVARTGPPEEEDIPEYKFYYDACLKSSINADTGTGTLRFSGNVTNQFRVSSSAPGTMDVTEVKAREAMGDTCRHTATLTDNKSFVFFSNCWLKADQRSWDVISTKRELGKEELAMIDEHAIKMGFEKKNFAFMKCWKWPEDED